MLATCVLSDSLTRSELAGPVICAVRACQEQALFSTMHFATLLVMEMTLSYVVQLHDLPHYNVSPQCPTTFARQRNQQKSHAPYTSMDRHPRDRYPQCLKPLIYSLADFGITCAKPGPVEGFDPG